MGSWGVPLARILYYIALIPAQLRKSGVVMDRHATLWLSEACGGTRLGACGRCVSSAVCRWRASAKQSENSEHSEHSEHSGWLADARAVVSRSWLSSSPPWRRWDVVCSGTACHRLRGVDIYVSSSSGYVADTPVGSIPGYAQPATASGVADYLAFGPHLSQSASGSDAFPCNPFNPCS